MAHLHTCVKVGNQIQYTGPDREHHWLKSGEIGTITDILLWADENPGMYMIYFSIWINNRIDSQKGISNV